LFNNRRPEDSPDNGEQAGRAQISWLRSLGDREALFQVMDGERQTERGLDAAEALVELGDVRGLDHLIAALRSSNSSLRHRAAQILKEMNHPRGLRALRDFHDEPGSRTAATIGSGRVPPREKLYKDLDSRGTDELVALWHEKNASTMSEVPLDVLSEILTERLGELPPEKGDAEGPRGDRIDEDVDPRIQRLWVQGDSDGLMRFFEGTTDTRLQLETAEALADLGDDDALAVLIEALGDPDQQISEMAAEILDWLDLPRGNQALEDHGVEFETGAEDLFRGPEPQAAAAARAPSDRPDPWATATQLPSTASIQPPPGARPLGTQTTGQQLESSAGSAGVFLVGAVGGLVGFIVFRFGLDVLGFLPLPADVAGWIQPRAIFYLGASILAGAVSGTVGSRVAQAIGRRLGWEPAEGDLLPVLGALVEGATSAMVVSLFMYSILKL
jgi:hypothetical protein